MPCCPIYLKEYRRRKRRERYLSMYNHDLNDFARHPTYRFLWLRLSDHTVWSSIGSKIDYDYPFKQKKLRVVNTRARDKTRKPYYRVEFQFSIGNKNRNFTLSRFIWECRNGLIPDGLTVDHIDRNTLNNNWDNLRLATTSQQNFNRGRR